MLFNKSVICFMHYNIFSSFTVGSFFQFRLKRVLIIEKKQTNPTYSSYQNSGAFGEGLHLSQKLFLSDFSWIFMCQYTRSLRLSFHKVSYFFSAFPFLPLPLIIIEKWNKSQLWSLKTFPSLNIHSRGNSRPLSGCVCPGVQRVI